jgi:glycosyltransferase involved in cell wall biosynthesis
MADNKPLVSIGMPVYNGEKYIRQALDSLLAQDYENFELIISDNASTDDTWEICQQYAVRDSRIQLYRNDENMGAIYNFHRVLELSSGKRFMWAAHDDLWRLGFISELVGLLEATPSAVLAMCRTEKIDYNGLPLHLGPLYLTTTGMTRAERLRYSAQHVSGWLLPGLHRTEIARAALSVSLDKRLVMGSPDVLFLHKCMDSGDLVFSEKVLFFKRQSSPRAQDESDSRSLSKMLRVLFWHCYGAFFKCYRLGGLSPREVGLIYWAIVQGLPQRSFYQHARRILRLRASAIKNVWGKRR